MKKVLIHTVDVPRERDWLRSKFPGSTFYETQSSGKWTGGQGIYEMPFFERHQTNLVFDEVYKSAFVANSMDCSWHLADMVLHRQQFSVDGSFDSFQVFTMGRAGTHFLESVLSQNYNQISPHKTTSVENAENIRSLLPARTVAALLYRKDWWGWVSSNIIAYENGYYHYNTLPRTGMMSTTGTTEHLDVSEATMVNNFDFWCNLRMEYPTHKFVLYEFSDIVEHWKTRTKHEQIPYDKRSLIENYDEIKAVFHRDYLPRWKFIEERMLSHLKSMNIERAFDGS